MTDGAAKPEEARATLLDCLALLARRNGLAKRLDQALAEAGHRAGHEVGAAKALRCAGRAGLRLRRLRGGWTALQQLSPDHRAIVTFVDGSSLVLSAIRRDADTDLIQLEDPTRPGADPITVDRIRFAAAWTSTLVLDRVRVSDVSARPFGWRTVAGFVSREPGLLRDTAAATLGLGLLAAVPILFVQLLLQRVLPFKAASSLLILALALLAAVVAEAILAAARGALMARLAGHLGARLGTAVFDRLLRLPAAALDRVPVGEAARHVAGLAAIGGVFGGPLLGAILDVGTAVIVLPLMLGLFPLLGSAVALALVLGLGGLAACAGRLRRGAIAIRRAEARRAAFLMQTLAGIGAIKGLALIPDRLRSWDRLTAAVGRAELDAARFTDLIAVLALPVERLLVSGTLALGIVTSVTAGAAARLAPLVAFYLLAQRLLAPLRSIATLAAARAEASAAMESLAALVNQPSEANDGGVASPAIHGGLAFDQVRFRYPDARRPALEDLTFAVEPGATLGIMGRSGAGKSTIARLLQGHHPAFGGTIRIDGVDLRTLDPQALRRAVAVVDAADTIFAGTIRETITAARPDAGFEAMVRAARVAGAEEFIDKLPRGYETMLHDGAPTLSTGQRQRLALARVLVTEPPILVLDEALSAVDAEIEAAVDANLREARRGRTTIIITHRLAALIAADVILVLENGRVRDVGRHADLLERCGPYSDAWMRQGGAPDTDAAAGEAPRALA